MNGGMQSEDDIVIDIKNVSYKIANKQILKEISFSIKRSEIFCIVGMSGSGKTSLLHCNRRIEPGIIRGNLGRRQADRRHE